MLVEDVATGERQRVAADFPVKLGQDIVVRGRRWRVVEVDGGPRDPDDGVTYNTGGRFMTVTVDNYVQTWMTRAWKDRDRSTIDDLIAEVHTSVGAGEPVEGRDGWRAFFDNFTGAMDDIDITVDGQITEGDVAAARWSGTMTHKATGTRIPLSGILHVKVKDGQATYGWNCIDWLPALFTLGYVQPDVMDRLFAG